MSVETCRIPLLKDSHTHPLIYAAFMHGIDLGRDAPDSRSTALELIHEHARSRHGGWTIAYGWNNARCTLSAEDFDGLPPVVVFNLSLHGMVVNASGMALLERQSPGIAANVHNQEWVERNLLSVLNALARDTVSPALLQRFFRWLLEAHGIWQAEEMLLVDAWELELFDRAELSDRTRFWAAPEQFEALGATEQARIHGIKLFTDGAMGTWTAALNEPYADTSRAGMLLYDSATLEGILRRYIGCKAIAAHAIGDRAIDQIVNALAAVGTWTTEVRVEHAQFISIETARKAKALGIRLCMQPNFSDDSMHYASRLPPGYAERNNPFRMLIDEIGFRPGGDLILGSDGMPHGFREALRQSLFPPHESQHLSLEEFVAGYGSPNAPGNIAVAINHGRREIDGRVCVGPLDERLSQVDRAG